MSDINSEIGNLTSAIEHLENTLRQSFVHSTPKPDTQASAIYMENISRKSDSGFASAVQKPSTSSDSVEEDSGESVKSEDREQFNSFQENCDEVVQMESENQELVVESFPFEQSDLRDDNSNEGRRTRRPQVWMKDYCP